MYRIYANNQPLHHPRLFLDGYIVIDPTLTEEVNTQGNLTFSVPPTNPLYDTLENRSTYIDVYDDNGIVWHGRVIYSEENVQRTKLVYCEGELAFLLDSIQRPFVYGGNEQDIFRQAIQEHNNQVDAARRFEVGVITVEDPNHYIYRSSEKPMTTWEFLKEKLFSSSLGGYIRTRRQNGRTYIDYISDFDHENTQTAEFGKNLTDLKRLISAEDIVTCLIPYGSKHDPAYKEDAPDPADSPNNIQRWGGDRLTIKAVNNPVGQDYIVNNSAVGIWGEIWGTQTWDDIKYANNLLAKAQDWLSLSEQIANKITVDAGAVDLSVIDIDAEALHVGDSVNIVSKAHDINIWLMCRKRVIPLMNLGDAQITLGAPDKTLTGMQGEANNE